MTETTDGTIVRLPGEGETTSLFGDTYTSRRQVTRPVPRSP